MKYKDVCSNNMLPHALPSVIPSVLVESVGEVVTVVGVEEQAAITKLKAAIPPRKRFLRVIKFPFCFD
jgi:hypothetical protein